MISPFALNIESKDKKAFQLILHTIAKDFRIHKYQDNNEIQKRIACENHFINENNKQDKAWFLEKVIIESSSYVEL